MIILAAMRRANPRNIIKLLYIFRNTAIDGTVGHAPSIDRLIFDLSPGMRGLHLRLHAGDARQGGRSLKGAELTNGRLGDQARSQHH